MMDMGKTEGMKKYERNDFGFFFTKQTDLNEYSSVSTIQLIWTKSIVLGWMNDNRSNPNTRISVCLK